MKRIQDRRRNVFVHTNSDPEQLPVEGVEEMPLLPPVKSFTPINLDDLTLYNGDVIVGLTDERVEFAELIYDRIDDGMLLVVPIEDGFVQALDEAVFSSRFYQCDEVHVYDGVYTEGEQPDIEFTPETIQREEPSRAR